MFNSSSNFLVESLYNSKNYGLKSGANALFWHSGFEWLQL